MKLLVHHSRCVQQTGLSVQVLSKRISAPVAPLRQQLLQPRGFCASSWACRELIPIPAALLSHIQEDPHPCAPTWNRESNTWLGSPRCSPTKVEAWRLLGEKPPKANDSIPALSKPREGSLELFHVDT